MGQQDSKLIIATRFIVILGLAAGIFAFGFLYQGPFLVSDGDSTKNVVIPRGSSLTRIADILHENGVLKEKGSFILFGKLLGKADKVKAGRYDFSGLWSIASIYSELERGRGYQVRITIPEGYNMYQIADLVAEKFGWPREEFLEVARSNELVRNRRVDAPSLEGYLFPDTYLFYDRDGPAKIARTMVNHFFEVFDSSMAARAEETGRTINEIVTMASMVQKETFLTEEMPIIAGVFYNRLRKGMLLQCDPTVLYALPDLGRPLRQKDLVVDSPYSTYIHRGLPPGPIANPGKKALLAALYPDDVPYLYFVADNAGRHVFSSTLRQHNNARIRIKRNARSSS